MALPPVTADKVKHGQKCPIVTYILNTYSRRVFFVQKWITQQQRLKDQKPTLRGKSQKLKKARRKSAHFGLAQPATNQKQQNYDTKKKR